MTSTEIINILTNTPKVYAGVMPQGTFSSIVTRIRRGECKPQTMKWFFEQFGYSPVDNEMQWEPVKKVE